MNLPKSDSNFHILFRFSIISNNNCPSTNIIYRYIGIEQDIIDESYMNFYL